MHATVSDNERIFMTPPLSPKRFGAKCATHNSALRATIAGTSTEGKA